MITNNQSTFLDVALHGSQDLKINGLLDGDKSKAKWQAAKAIAQMQSSTDVDMPIPNAIAGTFFDRQNRYNDGGVHSFVVIGFIQHLMDKVCWVARGYQERLNSAQMMANAIGKDYSQEAAEDIGITDDERFDVKAVVDRDYAILLEVQSDCLSALSNKNYDFQPLCYFQQSEPNPDGSGAWITTCTADSYDDALLIMENVVAHLNENQEAKRNQDIANVRTKTYGAGPSGVIGTKSDNDSDLQRHTNPDTSFDESDIPFGNEASA